MKLRIEVGTEKGVGLRCSVGQCTSSVAYYVCDNSVTKNNFAPVLLDE